MVTFICWKKRKNNDESSMMNKRNKNSIEMSLSQFGDLCVLCATINLMKAYGDTELVADLSKIKDYNAWISFVNKYCPKYSKYREMQAMVLYLQKKNYEVKRVKISNIHTYLFHIGHLCVINEGHCVSVYKKYLYDGNNAQKVKIGKKNLDISCGGENHFQKVFLAYSIEKKK